MMAEQYVVTIHKIDPDTATDITQLSGIKIFEQRVSDLDIHKFISALNVKKRVRKAKG